jgi:hypothetical protein
LEHVVETLKKVKTLEKGKEEYMDFEKTPNVILSCPTQLIKPS